MSKSFEKAVAVCLLMLIICGSFSDVTMSFSAYTDEEPVNDSPLEEGEIYYTLNDDGLLHIYGTGEIPDDFLSESSIKQVVIDNGVTGIGCKAFNGCRNLKSITIPDSVTKIGDRAFDYCTSLESIIIPDSVTSIDGEVFAGCSGLGSITIPDSVTSIGDSAFGYCISLESIIIPDSVLSIGREAFGGCTRLENINIPESVTSIGSGAFYDCASIAGISIPDSVKSIGDNAFNGCSNLKSIIIPESVTSIGSEAFEYCVSLESIYVEDANENYSSCGGILLNKNKTEIIKCPQAKYEGVIPDGVTSICDYAFNGCTNLMSINIPDSITQIGDWAFGYCTGLDSITIPENVTGISDDAFHGCSNLKSIIIPDSLTSIGYYAFYGCISLESISIPDGVTSIGPYAFYDCCNLESINIPDSVTIIGDWAFYDCISLKSITIPDSIKKINKRLFCSCSSLKSITIPDGVTNIGDRAFYECSSLESIIIPDSVTRIGIEEFYSCSESLKITGKSGSYAEKYANDNGIEFVELETELNNISSFVPESVIAGMRVTIKGNARGGKEPYTYAYYYKRSVNTKWNRTGAEYSEATSAGFTPIAAADYDIKVIVRDANGKTAEKLMKLTVKPKLTNNSWINAEKVQIGDDIRLTGAAEGGTGGYKYSYYFKRSKNSKWNKIGTDSGTASYAITVPKAAEDYDMKAVVMDSSGTKAEKIFKVTVVESLPLTNISLINAGKVSIGKTVTVSGRVAGGAKPVTFEFFFKRSQNTKWNKLSYGSEKGTYAKFTPTKAAEYDIRSVVIDANGTKCEKIFRLTAE